MVLTSFHQSPLPTALLLRLAGVRWIAAVSEDYPGSLLDVRLPVPDDAPEPVRMLQSVREAGFPLPAGDAGRLQVRRPLPDVDALLPVEPGVPLVAVHPGTSAPARAYPWPLWATAVERLIADGWQVVLTGSRSEQPLTRRIVAAVSGSAAGTVHDLAGTVDLAQLAAVLDRARGHGGRQHRAGAPVRRGGHSGGVAVRAGGAGAAMGAVRRTGRAVGRSGRAVQGHPVDRLSDRRPPVPDVGVGRADRQRRAGCCPQPSRSAGS